jgi:hypothetical protein
MTRLREVLLEIINETYGAESSQQVKEVLRSFMESRGELSSSDGPSEQLTVVQMDNELLPLLTKASHLLPCLHEPAPNVVVKWFTLLLRIREATPSNFGTETGYPD